jgi:hypothetical protein
VERGVKVDILNRSYRGISREPNKLVKQDRSEDVSSLDNLITGDNWVRDQIVSGQIPGFVRVSRLRLAASYSIYILYTSKGLKSNAKNMSLCVYV